MKLCRLGNEMLSHGAHTLSITLQNSMLPVRPGAIALSRGAMQASVLSVALLLLLRVCAEILIPKECSMAPLSRHLVNPNMTASIRTSLDGQPSDELFRLNAYQ